MAQCPPPSPGGPAPPAELAASAAAQLLLVASAIRFCDRFKPEHHPVLPVLQGCWPLLMQTTMTFRSDTAVVNATCELYARCMGTLKGLLLGLLPQMLHHLADSFATT